MNKRKDQKNINSEKTKTVNTSLSSFWVRLIIFVLISILLSSTYFIKNKLEGFVNFSYNRNALSTIIQSDGIKIHFIDVGQADATLIEFPTGEIMLIDCGDTSESSHSKFVSYLSKINFSIEDEEKVLDYLILTHPDSDHIGGAEYIFENFKVKHCYRPDIYASNEELPEDTSLIVQLYDSENSRAAQLYANVISKIYEEEGCIVIKTVQELEISSVSYNSETAETDISNWIINFYAPIVSELPYRTNDDYQRPITNDYSPIFILSYLDKKIMFTGDASDKVEKAFINFYDDEMFSYIDFDIDILKLGHHGSRYSTCEEFLNFVTPEYVIASVGANNQYKHPSSHTIERLNNYGIDTNSIYRTDLNGNIIIGVSKNGALSLKADFVQYSTFWFEWWIIHVSLELVLLIATFLPYSITLIKEKNKQKKQNK